MYKVEFKTFVLQKALPQTLEISMLVTTGHSSSMTNQSFPMQTTSGKPQVSLFSTVFPKIEGLFSQAAKIAAYRSSNYQWYVASILNNMGFQESRNSFLNRIICALNSSDLRIGSISKTSDLGRFLQEFRHRERAFELIAKHGKDVAERILSDVVHPVSVELRKSAEEQALNSLQQKSL